MKFDKTDFSALEKFFQNTFTGKELIAFKLQYLREKLPLQRFYWDCYWTVDKKNDLANKEEWRACIDKYYDTHIETAIKRIVESIIENSNEGLSMDIMTEKMQEIETTN